MVWDSVEIDRANKLNESESSFTEGTIATKNIKITAKEETIKAAMLKIAVPSDGMNTIIASTRRLPPISKIKFITTFVNFIAFSIAEIKIRLMMVLSDSTLGRT